VKKRGKKAKETNIKHILEMVKDHIFLLNDLMVWTKSTNDHLKLIYLKAINFTILAILKKYLSLIVKQRF